MAGSRDEGKQGQVKRIRGRIEEELLSYIRVASPYHDVNFFFARHPNLAVTGGLQD
jgi:hypothetical protein